jgi:hypothetical protein
VQLDQLWNFSWGVNFVLPMPAATSGWIVQELSYELNITGGKQDKRLFWEAFYVAQGAIRCIYFPLDFNGNPVGPDDHATLGPDDTYKDLDPHPSNSMGLSMALGKARFYEGTLPADFIRENPQTLAGDRRSTTTQPAFWDGTGTDHNLTVTWDCSSGTDIKSMSIVPVDPINPCPDK